MRTLPRWAKALLLVEVVLCFAPAIGFLIAGAFMLPMQIRFFADEPLEWEGLVSILAMVGCGIIGLVALVFVLSQLLGQQGSIRRPIVVLLGVALGSAPLLTFVVADELPLQLMGIAPIACTIHILYLSRHLMLPLVRPVVEPRAPRDWIVTAPAIAPILIAATLIWRLYSSEGELVEERERWLHSRPQSYSYDLHIAGWTKPDLLLPRRITVSGDQVVAAEYTFTPGPFEQPNYPPANESAWTMDTLFDELLAAKKKGARVRARFDEQTGYVHKALIDYQDHYASWSLQVKDFTPVTQAPLQPGPKS